MYSIPSATLRPVQNARALNQSIPMAGQDHYAQVQGCISLLELIERQEHEGIPFDPSLTAHLTPRQRDELKLIVRKSVSGFMDIADGSHDEGVMISGQEYDPETFAVFQKMLFSTARKVIVPRRGKLLQRSVLISIVIGFETMLIDLATAAIRNNPKLANLENATLSLAELGSLGTVEEATDYLISRQVEDLARGSIDDWEKWFAKIGVKLREIPADWVEFREIFARRNLFVHTNGRVSAQYVSVLSGAGAPGGDIPAKGSNIDITTDYLAESCELVISTGALLVTSVWMKLADKDSQLPVAWILHTADLALEDGNFAACVRITEKITQALGSKLDLVASCRLKVTNWASRAMLGEEDVVAKEAEVWDVRGLDSLYSHFRSVFIRDDERAISELTLLVDQNRLSKHTVLTSKSYEKLRERSESALLQALKIDVSGVAAVRGAESAVDLEYAPEAGTRGLGASSDG
ncbi:hypothetical protein [Arthrobacter sp. zg-Y179]|uniref:hypothetical protein n=1 Tax=Arthrobacter sp. zg-Y179 TaxID=2894188 RepID=UPI001E63087E|nr:hypothetical protein [Arthrobacter sp. zg-Y179]MCC9173493.1 hypothetical protein [Arthrobacter sp. zg-Y179]